jgi:hypothetical protein
MLLVLRPIYEGVCRINHSAANNYNIPSKYTSVMSRTSAVLRQCVIIHVLTSYVTSISSNYTKLVHIIVSITSAKFIIQINRTSSGLSDKVLDKERPIGVVS